MWACCKSIPMLLSQCRHRVRVARCWGQPGREENVMLSCLWSYLSASSSLGHTDIQTAPLNVTGVMSCSCKHFFKCFPPADEDECAVRNPCSHTCHNAMGSYHCSCPKGLTIAADGRMCQGKGSCRGQAGYKEPHSMLSMERCFLQAGPFGHCMIGVLIIWLMNRFAVTYFTVAQVEDVALSVCHCATVRFTAFLYLQMLMSVPWAGTAATPTRTVRTALAHTAACCAAGPASGGRWMGSAARVWQSLDFCVSWSELNLSCN